jgi:hypothetical protein
MKAHYPFEGSAQGLCKSAGKECAIFPGSLRENQELILLRVRHLFRRFVIQPTTSASGTRLCSSVSRSRIVTVWSLADS